MKVIKIEIQLFLGWKAHTILIIILPLVFTFGVWFKQILGYIRYDLDLRIKIEKIINMYPARKMF